MRAFNLAFAGKQLRSSNCDSQFWLGSLLSSKKANADSVAICIG